MAMFLFGSDLDPSESSLFYVNLFYFYKDSSSIYMGLETEMVRNRKMMLLSTWLTLYFLPRSKEKKEKRKKAVT